MSTSNLLDLIKEIKAAVNNQDWEGLKQLVLNLKNYMATVENPIIRELAELNEFIKALEEVLRYSQSDNKMIFQAKLEFIQIKIFSIENIVENLNADFKSDLDDLSEALGELGVTEEDMITPIIEEISPPLNGELKKQVDTKLEPPSMIRPPTGIPQQAEKPPAGAPSELTPSFLRKSPPVGPPKPMTTGPPKPMATSPPKPMTAGPPKPMATSPPKPMATSPPKPMTAGPPKPMTAGPPKPIISSPSSKTISSDEEELEYVEASLIEEKREENVPFSYLTETPPTTEIAPPKRKKAASVDMGQKIIESESVQAQETASNMLQRNTRVSYFDQMNPDTNYMLTVKITKEQIERIQSETVTHVYSSFEVEKTEQKPTIIKVVPFFPGCLVTPNQAEVNIDEEKQEVLFWITPLVLGEIDACVEFWHEGKRVDKVDTPTKIVTQTISKVFATAGVVSGVVPAALEFLNIDVNGYLSLVFSSYAPQLQAFFSVWGILIIEIIIVSALIALGVFFYLRKKPTKTEVEK